MYPWYLLTVHELPKYNHTTKCTRVLMLKRNSKRFIEPEDSLPYSQNPATISYPEQDEFGSHAPKQFL
jgi:hypothetical protein